MKAVYAGSFDPPTCGHLNIIERASSIFPDLIVAIGVNSAKKPLFPLDERTAMLDLAIRQRPVLVQTNRNIRVTSFDGLLIDYCKANEINVMVRGLRAATDFDYELGIAQANATQDRSVQTIFFSTEPKYSFVSSSVVKEIAKYGGNVTEFVDRAVELRLFEKFGRDSRGFLPNG